MMKKLVGSLVFAVAVLAACDQVGAATSEAAQALASASVGHGPPPGMCAPPVADGVDLGVPPPHGAPPPAAGGPGAGGPGTGDDGAAPGPRGGGPQGALALIYDDDESRSLSDDEKARLDADLAAGCTAKNARLLAEFDVDDSGDLAQDEWDAARAELDAARDAARGALDTDGDGALSDAERAAAADEFLATWDSDGDGALDADERATFRAAMQALVRAGEPLPFMPPPPPATTND